MNRYITCKNCRKEFRIKSDAPSRHELEDELGRYFYSTCSHCHIDQEYHVNEVKAEESKISIVSYIVAAVLTAGLITFGMLSFGVIGIAIVVIPILIYVRLKQGSEKSVRLFNQSDISRTRPR